MTVSEATAYLGEQIDQFVKETDPKAGKLLELTIMQMNFLRLMKLQMGEDLNDAGYIMLRKHLMATLEIAAGMMSIEPEIIDRVVTKSIELVDCMNAMADPTRTNLH